MRGIAILVGIVALAACSRPPKFERLDPDHTGITFNNLVLEKDSFNILHNEYMYNGGGVGIADLNQDGLQDVILVGNKVLTRVYLNLGDFEFRDITDRLKGLDDRQWLSGVAVTDINADGWPDLYVASTQSDDSLMRTNRLWVNQGLSDGLPLFSEQAAKYGIDNKGHSMHSAFLDYDLDGDLDLYVLNNIVSQHVPTNYRPKITDGSAINNDAFYENLGNGTFRDITVRAGITYEGYGLGIAVGDVNVDGWPDLYISNDYIANDLLYINQKDGTFRNEAEAHVPYQSRFSMGNDMADVNNDGWPDIMTLDMMPEKYSRKKQTINGNSYLVYVNNERYDYEPQYVRNMVHLHNGFSGGRLLPFSEVGQMMGVYQTEWSWSPLFVDFDNDGDRDLFITNGFPKDLTDKDFTNYKAQVYGSFAGDEHMLERIPIVKVSNYAYENVGTVRFEDRTADWGLDIPSFSNGASHVDLDNDGDLDYVVNNINDPAFVYRNNTRESGAAGANYLRLELKGNAPNTMAIGAKVEAWFAGKYLFAEHHLSRGYLSSVEPIVHLGVGTAASVDSIRISWPTRERTTLLRDVPANQLLEVAETGATDKSVNIPGETATLFESTHAMDFFHRQSDYIDFFQGQSVIQHKFSQIGPCMAGGDLNGDGEEDLLVGGSAEQPAAVFLKDGDRFTQAAVKGLTEVRVCQESDLAILDADGDGDQDVIVSGGGYAAEKPEDYRHFLYRNEAGSFSRVDLPLPSFPASVVRPFDFDKDGDMDVFIGARVKRRSFPLADASALLINTGPDISSWRKLELDLGMITDACWTDADGDGWTDLAIAREWNSLVLLRNNEGQSLAAGEAGLSAYRGFWSALHALDADGDGDEDLLAGNLGENHRFTVSDKFPIRVYAVDVDRNGTIDPIATSYWKDDAGVMTEYPINYLDELSSQSPFFRKKFTSYTKFSTTPFSRILKPDSIPATQKYFVNTTSSFLLRNNKGAYSWERLPDACQVAPVRKMISGDFNGDGHVDVIVSGNDHSYDVSTGYYSASLGVLMTGSPAGFTVVPPSKSGLHLGGQIDALQLFGGDKPLLVVGVNRDSARVYRLSGR
jgi:hypothetical protein